MRPASERDVIELEGSVTEAMRGDLYRVECVAGALRRTVLAKRSGHLNKHNIRTVVGDSVRVEVSPYDLSKGRITFRLT